MAFTHGKNTAFWLADSGGTYRELTAFLTDVSMPQNMDMAETSVFNNTNKTYIQGLSDASLSISGRWDPTATTGPDVVLNGLIGAASASGWEYYPNGEVNDGARDADATHPRYDGTAYLSAYEVTSSIGDVVSFTAEFQMASQIARDVA